MILGEAPARERNYLVDDSMQIQTPYHFYSLIVSVKAEQKSSTKNILIGARETAPGRWSPGKRGKEPDYP